MAARDLVLPAGPSRSIRVARGSILAISPWLSHRDAAFGEAPGAFRPQRYQDAGGSSASGTAPGSAAGRKAGGTRDDAMENSSCDSAGAAPAAEQSGLEDCGRAGAKGANAAGGELSGIPGVTQTGMAFGGGRFRCDRGVTL